MGPVLFDQRLLFCHLAVQSQSFRPPAGRSYSVGSRAL